MSLNRRIVPEWKQVLPQITQAIKKQEEKNREHSQKMMMCLDAAPHSQFRYSCCPNYIQCLSVFSEQSGTTVVTFQWGYKMTQHQMKVWTENSKGKLCLNKSIALNNDYKIHHLLFIPSQKVFVSACSDLLLRVFSEPAQGMTLQYNANLLSSVFCMHYSNQTEEVLTGSMGMITFWGFWTTPEVQLGVTRVLDWNCCSLDRDSTVNALITVQQTSTLYALCDHSIKSFDIRSKKELRIFKGHGRAILHCVASDWVQQYLFTGDISGCVQIWSQGSRTLLQEFQAHFCSVSSIVIRPNKRTILTSSADGWVKEWNSSGQLLFKLLVDDPSGVRTLWPIGEYQVLCHSPSSVSVWKLQSIYQLFYESFCSMQHLRRVECGFGWARLLAISQSSLVLLSPVSGEMLVFSWPFLFLKQALDFAYNPSQEELFVSNGTSEVLVLDMTRCPSPVKQILCTRRNKEEDESVMCLEAVMLCGEGWADTKPRPYLVFSGHCSGKLQLLSPSRFHCQVPNAHSDAVLQISSIPGENPQLCCYGADRKLSVWVVKAGEKQIKLTCTTHIYCSTSMILTQLTPGLIFAVSQGHNLLLYSLLDGNCLQLERISSTPISCMDYCASLGLVVISGPAGIVEVWDTHGILLVVIKLGAPVSQVCFANTRGDLLACFNDSIFIIFAVKYLPICMLKQMPAHNQADDLLEDPLPFLQQSFGYYDLDLVSRMLLKPVETKSSEIKTTEPEVEALEPETNMQLSHMEILIEASNQPNILTNKEDQGSQPYRPQVKSKLDEKIQIAEESKEPDTTNDVWNKVETSLEPIILRQEPSGWPVAPDGYIPNSVIRNWGQNQEPEKSKLEVGKPKILQETYGLLEDAHISETVKIVPKDQAQRILKPALLLKQPAQIESVTELHIEKDVNSHKTLLQIIAESPWLVKKPKAVELNPVVSSLTLTMDSMDPDVYDNCTTALCSLYQTYEIPPETKEMLSLTLLQNMQKGNPHWKRLRALKILFQLKLLKEKDMAVIAEVLIDKEHDLHQMARDVLAQVYSIKYKDKLLDHLCSKEVSTRKKLFKQLDDHLTEDLQLQQNIPAVCPKTTREVTVPVSNGHPTPQYDDMSAQMQSYSNIKGITPSDIPALKRHVPAQPSQAPVKVNKSDMSPSEHLKPTQHIRKKYRKFNISFPKRKAILSKSGASYLSLSDSTLVDLYKKIKTKRLTYCPLLLPKPEGLVHMPPTISHQPELNYWEPIKGQGQHNWRENLYHLISQYGFRSPNASRIVRQDPPPTPVQGNLSCTLPTIPTSHLTAGQRLVERIWFKKTLFPSQFHHIQPLPEQLNVHTLDHSGESQYGRLKVDWRAGLMDCTGIKLAPTGTKMAL